MNTTPELFNSFRWILGSLLASVCLAGAIGWALGRRSPDSPAIRNLNARIRSWLLLIVIGGAALLAGRLAVVLLFALVSFLALREFVDPAQVQGLNTWTRFVLFFLALPAQYLLVALDWRWPFTVAIPVLGFLALPLLALRGGAMRFLDRAGVAHFGLMSCVYCLSHIPALGMLRIPGYEDRAPLLMVFAVLIAQVSDIAQYILGKLLGRRPVAPAISPSKTVEGLVGGVLSATLLGALLWRITPFSAWQSALMALLIAIFGFLGGLVMSAIKRDRGIKDWGGAIKGHGGMLDRVDSLCLSAPVFYHATRYFFGG